MGVCVLNRGGRLGRTLGVLVEYTGVEVPGGIDSGADDPEETDASCL